jgi:hypothetical protein
MYHGNADLMEESHNKWKDEEKIYIAATVQYHISKAAPILTIQLKRFDKSHPRLDKLEERVSFQNNFTHLQ